MGSDDVSMNSFWFYSRFLFIYNVETAEQKSYLVLSTGFARVNGRSRTPEKRKIKKA